ncbi:GIY-YIG_SF domain containing protein [Methylophilaceae bacterium]
MLNPSDDLVLSALFDSSSELRPFTLSNIKDIPSHGSIIYTVFLDKSEFIYVGIGGLSGKSVLDRNPQSRIRQHTQGTRSGDQFCIYIQDFYVLPTLLGQPYTPVKGRLDRLTKEFIRTRLSYRYAVIQSNDSDKVVRRLERELQSGQHGHGIPKLNGMPK